MAFGWVNKAHFQKILPSENFLLVHQPHKQLGFHPLRVLPKVIPNLIKVWIIETEGHVFSFFEVEGAFGVSTPSQFVRRG